MPVSSETVGDLFRQIHVLARSTKSIAGRGSFEGLRLGAAMMLGYVESIGEIRCRDLAEQLGLDTSVVSRQLAVLEGHGLTARRPDPNDGRAWLSHVTPAGTELLSHLRDQRLRVIEQAMTGWDENEAKALLTQLSRLETDLLKADGKVLS